MAKSHLTKAEAGRVARFAAEVVSILGMARWRVSVMEEPAPDDTVACIKPITPYYRAEMKLHRDWSRQPVEIRRSAIVHEVCHLLHYQVDHVLEDAGGLMHDHEHEQVATHYERAVEYMVDLLTTFVEEQADVRAAWDSIYGGS